MFLQQLKITSVRNLKEITLQFSPRFNIFWGKNGSGKTSLLEAIHLLATGRSFRSNYAEEFISFEAPSCVLSGKTSRISPKNKEFIDSVERADSLNPTLSKIDAQSNLSQSALDHEKNAAGKLPLTQVEENAAGKPLLSQVNQVNQVNQVDEVNDIANQLSDINKAAFYSKRDCPVTPLGLERHRSGGINIQINHQKCNSIAELAQLLPLQIINTETYSLLEGSSKLRRQFIDWGMFHVEHLFFSNWQRYTRALKQRNAALKRVKIEGLRSVNAWEPELIETGEKLHNFREDFISGFIPLLSPILEDFFHSLGKFTFTYRSGWNREKSLSEAFASSVEYDVLRGYTTQGPHRGNLAIHLEDIPAETVLSRGQQKLLICALMIARAEWLYLRTGRRSLFLVDDLTSELDNNSCHWLLEKLCQHGGQVIITAIESEFIENFLQNQSHDYELFHVEHGQIKLKNMISVE